MLRFDLVYIYSRVVPLIFCVNVQTGHYNGHPQHFEDELFDYLGWLQVGIGNSSRTDFVYLCLVLELYPR